MPGRLDGLELTEPCDEPLPLDVLLLFMFGRVDGFVVVPYEPPLPLEVLVLYPGRVDGLVFTL